MTIALPAAGEGMIRIHGELWRAGSAANVPVGARVRVLQVDGLKLDVERSARGDHHREVRSSRNYEEVSDVQVGGIGILIIGFFFLLWFWNSIYVIKEWERGVVLRLGTHAAGGQGRGLALVFWPIETLYRIRCGSKRWMCLRRTSSRATTFR